MMHSTIVKCLNLETNEIYKHSVACVPFPELHKELQHQQELAELRQLFLFPLHLCVLTVLIRGRRSVHILLALYPDDCLIHIDYSQLASTFIP